LKKIKNDQIQNHSQAKKNAEGDESSVGVATRKNYHPNRKTGERKGKRWAPKVIGRSRGGTNSERGKGQRGPYIH